MAGVAALGSASPRCALQRHRGAGKGVGERLVPPGKLGIQHFSVRDAITRRSIASNVAAGLTPTRGYLGGPNFPADPTDLGPLVDLPGGFAETFEYLAGLGYRGFEFFQFTQNAIELGRQPTHAEIRTYLDNAGLASFGTHTGGLGSSLTGTGGNSLYNPTTGGLSAGGQTQLDIAAALGHTMIGTAGDPTNQSTLANGATTAGWTEMAHRANVIGQVLADNGLRWYWHTEQNGWQFFTTPGLERTHRIDWWTANTDPRLVFFEPDVLHSLAGRARFPDPVDGSRWDALGFWKANSHRLVGWHIKDGNRLVPAPAPTAEPVHPDGGPSTDVHLGRRVRRAKARSGRATRWIPTLRSWVSGASSTRSGRRARGSTSSRATAASGAQRTRVVRSGTPRSPSRTCSGCAAAISATGAAMCQTRLSSRASGRQADVALSSRPPVRGLVGGGGGAGRHRPGRTRPR